MNCPICGGKTRVIDSSFNYVDNERYRKRLCTKCGKKYIVNIYDRFCTKCGEKYED